MKSINLLPRKPFLEKWFLPLLIGVAGLCVLAFIGLTSGTLFLQDQHQRQLDDINRLTAKIREATELRKPDPLSIEFDRYKQLIEGLESTRFMWVPLMDTIAQYMPETARLQSASYSLEQKKITVNAEFRTMEDASAYVGALRSSPFFSDVFVSSLAKQEMNTRAYYALTAILSLNDEEEAQPNAP